ncbi:MAG: hypothetical protein WC109_01240 [Syntrophomonadaceae bacterium]|nr:hypothetical protein [Syntrophomonadaceae bacterium]
MNNKERYTEILTELGANQAELDEILAYNERSFGDAPLPADGFPLPDQLFARAWQEYCHAAETRGAFRVLQDHLVQLSFPIQEGISQTEAYRTATLRGIPQEQWAKGNALALVSPEKLSLSLYQTPAGAIPVLLTRERRDFIILVQALAQRNETKIIPDSMGACMVKGYNNWGRIFAYRRQWQKDNSGKGSEEAWAQEFNEIMAHKELYQDTFLILSDGYYSGISAQEMGLHEQEWKELSWFIRREHEATHYFTQRVFGSAKNHVLDETIADYMGIVAANGSYRADWFLHFMGLENYPQYRAGGRLQNYFVDFAMSAGAFKIMQSVVKQAANNLEGFDKTIGNHEDKARIIKVLCRLSLLDMIIAGSFDQIIQTL